LIEDGEYSRTTIGERSMVVVATQGHGDEEAVERAVMSAPAYIGLVASQRRGEAVLGYLAQRGIPTEQLDRVRSPAGLDLGRTSHREVAVAILAELVQLRASGALATVAASGADTRVTEPADAVDPVCGMTVPTGPSSHPFRHDGVTYYFCGAGCEQAFQDQPAGYLSKGAPC
jgi:xanthine dehydrogenase accessory factor